MDVLHATIPIGVCNPDRNVKHISSVPREWRGKRDSNNVAEYDQLLIVVYFLLNRLLMK
jgi:hypothetical protein